MEKSAPGARTCYEAYLSRTRTRSNVLAGRIALKLVVGPSGAVEDVEVAMASLNEQLLQQCMFAVVRRLQFPPVEGGGKVVVTWPFNFAPAE